MKTYQTTYALFLLFFICCCTACQKAFGPEPLECPQSTYFCIYDDYSSEYVNRPHFNTPDGRWFRIYDQGLSRVTLSGPIDFYETEGDIALESVRVMPDGGIFFHAEKLYYLSPNGTLKNSYGGYFPYSEYYWPGGAFTTADGHYGYVDRDGNGIRVTLRDTDLQWISTINLPNIPQGDCLGAYIENDKYTVVYRFLFQNNYYVKRYRFYQIGNTTHLQTQDVQIPAEAIGKEWYGFKPDGAHHATFHIYEHDAIKHYRIDIADGGAYTTLSNVPRDLLGPNCYYRFDISDEKESNYFILTKYAANSSSVLWERKIPTGASKLSGTYGWANAAGVYLISHYQSSLSSSGATCFMYFSADGQLCE